MLVYLLPLVADETLPSWTAPTAVGLLMSGISWITYASIKGIITWPPEKQRMQDTIDLVVGVLQESNQTTQRTLPTTARLVEVVEARVEPEIKVSQADLIAALRVVASEGKRVVESD